MIANSIRGSACNKSLQKHTNPLSPADFLNVVMMYLSKLKITAPQNIPNPIAGNSADISIVVKEPSLNTVYKAYPPAIAANIPVKRTVPPILAYFAHSCGQFFMTS